MNFPVCDKLKPCILNTFEYSEQYKKKSGNSSNKYPSAIKLLKTKYFGDLREQKAFE